VVPYIVYPVGSLDPIMLAKSYEGWWVSILSRAKKWVYLNTLGRLDLGRASGLHFTSKADMESTHRLKVRPSGYVLPLGVDRPPKVERQGDLQIRGRFPGLRDNKIVLFLARLAPNKGLDILVSALSELAKRRCDFALVVAGSGARSYEREMASLVRSHGLQDRTVFLGLLEGDQKWSVLDEADVFVLPSHHENFPMSVAEALASEVPVIISDRVKIHQEISAAGAGIVTSLDPKDVAAAIERLLADDPLRAEMGAAAGQLAREQLSWHRAAKLTARAYEDIVTRSRASAVR
jgi:glycosyltransferase involved in cell wall biosynthesis